MRWKWSLQSFGPGYNDAQQEILIVDDEAMIREELVECLSAKGYVCVAGATAEDGLDLIQHDREISIVLSDLHMPGRIGLEMIATAKAGSDEQRIMEFVVITGHSGVAEAIGALKLGAMDFLQKPVDVDHMIHVVRRAEELVLLKKAKQHFDTGLKADIDAKTIEIRRLNESLESAYAQALDCLAEAAEYKDLETGNHISRIGEYAQVIARDLGWSKKQQNMIRLSAALHDAGKIGTPDSILLKPGKLTKDELVIMKQHSEIGHQILSKSSHPVMMMAAHIAWAHHERWNGTGYPRELRGSEIPLEARITTVADIYDALRSERPYKPGFEHEKALSIMLEGDGRTNPSHFDPKLLEIFRANSYEFDNIFSRLAD
jgi:putative two-component system response regulator